MGKLRDQLMSAQAERETFEIRQAEIETRMSRADREISLTLLLCGIAAFYLAVRFGLTTRLDALGTYASYIFEIGLVILTALILRPRLAWGSLIRLWPIAGALVLLAAGFGIQKLARISGLTIPMNVSEGETVLFLIVVAPILEEFVFRFLLWKPIERATSAKTAWITTSLLFAYSHLHAIWFVPAEYQKFLIYQTAYTLPLGLACGWMLRKQNSLLPAILLHFAFNLGFFLAFRF